MDDALGVRRREHAGGLAADVGDIGDREAPRLVDARRERLALEELHDEVSAAGRGEAAVEDPDRAGVLDLADRDGFVEEPIDLRVIGRDVRVQQLDRDLGVDLLLLGQEHVAHAARADLADDRGSCRWSRRSRDPST